MSVWKTRQTVLESRRSSVWKGVRTFAARSLSRVALLLALVSSWACGEHPEQQLAGRWQELEWRYEKLERRDIGEAPRLPRIPHHEAEYWDFRPDGTLMIATREGSRIRARWQLKGRGHVLRIESDDGLGVEVYDIKVLDRDQLVLNYNLGMEVRGIARLRFHRRPRGTDPAAASARAHVSREARDALLSN